MVKAEGLRIVPQTISECSQFLSDDKPYRTLGELLGVGEQLCMDDSETGLLCVRGI